MTQTLSHLVILQDQGNDNMLKRFLRRGQPTQRYWVAFKIGDKRYVLERPYITEMEAEDRGIIELSGAANLVVIPLKTADKTVAGKLLKAQVISKEDAKNSGVSGSKSGFSGRNVFGRR